MAELVDILKAAIARKASDIFVVADQPPMIRFGGEMAPLPEFPAIDSREVGRLIMSNLFEEQRKTLQEKMELDCSLVLPQVARFRMNITTQKSGLHAVIRPIPANIPHPEDLDLPEAVTGLADLARGLVLITGPAGSGKSSTLVCLLDAINQKRSAHIVTLEDPIEFSFSPKNSLFCQREVGTHTLSYSAALKSIPKQNADVVSIAELRDKDTAEAALHIAESGALVFATLPTTDSMHTIERIVNMFPVEQHKQIQLRLASNLKAAVSQILLARSDGKGMIAAREILLMNPTVESAIREGKTPQIYPAIDAGAKQGMVLMDKSILKLVRNKLVNVQEALEKCHHPDSLQAAMAALK